MSNSVKYPKPVNSLLSDAEWNELASFFSADEQGSCSPKDVEDGGKLQQWLVDKSREHPGDNCILCGNPSKDSQNGMNVCQNCYSFIFYKRRLRSQKQIHANTGRSTEARKFCFGRPKYSSLTVREWRAFIKFYNPSTGYCAAEDVQPGGKILNWIDEMGKKYSVVTENDRCFLCGDYCSAEERIHSLCNSCYTAYIGNGCLRTKESINAISIDPSDERNKPYPKPLLSYMTDEDWDKLVACYDTPDKHCTSADTKPGGKVYDIVEHFREKYANAKHDGKCFVCGQFFSTNKRVLKSMCQNCYQAFFMSRKVRSDKLIRRKGALPTNNMRCKMCGKVGVYSNGLCRSCLAIEERKASGLVAGTFNSRKVALELNKPLFIPDGLVRRNMGYGVRNISDIDTLITVE